MSGLALCLCIKNGDIETLNYLWNNLYYLWTVADLSHLIDCMYNYDMLDALTLILKGKAFKNIILSLSFREQVFYLEKILFDTFDKDTLFSLSTFFDSALSTPDFSTQYLYLNLKREYYLKDLLDVCF